VLAIKDTDLLAHRQQILDLAKNEEKRAKIEHPLSRIIGIKEEDGTMTISTTDTHLARRIGEALNQTLQGKVLFHYTKDEQFVRAEWTREKTGSS